MIRPDDFELLLVRHGDAEDDAPGGDAARALTAPGQAAICRVGAALARLELSWSEAWTSPYLRAKQTSALIHEQLSAQHEAREGHPLPAPQETETLVVYGDATRTARHLIKRGWRQHGPRPCIAAFGHEPNLSSLASLLLGGDAGAVRLSWGRGDVMHLLVPAPSHFDQVLAPQAEEPLPHAVLLGFWPSSLLEQLGGGVG